MYSKFSVLMSIYHKEKVKNFRLAIESIYEQQILKPNEIVLVEDGELTEELYAEIEKQKKKLNGILKIVSLKKNQGLGIALSQGLLQCSSEIVARMDTDDIAFPNRFQEQIKFMGENPNIDISGTFMKEFIDTPQNIIAIKDAPIENIHEYMKYRSPLNHPTVIFKKSKVLEAGNYQELTLYEDYYLWIRMAANNCIFANIDKELLYFRVTDDTYKRRGGIKYIFSEIKFLKKFLKLNLISKKEFLIIFLLKTLMRLIPNFLRKLIYIKILRKKVN